MHKIMWGLWWLSAACGAMFLVWIGWGVFSFMTDDDPFNTITEVDCHEAVDYAGAAPPARTSDEQCTSYSWLDQSYDGTWRMPRAEVAPWLKESYPHETPTTRCGGGDDVCLDVGTDLPSGVDEVELTVVYEDGDTALVHLRAYST
ncbi:hypothetical protein [Streptomyces chiangmaiensis]|uniref:Secreted protein n=1 Tax=Streptomyces chiangmaiensis TaxID=766497 RepID=A0ABU7FEP5_9ACTN|nr:hypothetical protein [Streptomyces chiangmaiensis]MED7822621.1 hypothetical protein [Streptomyces chiangmaiensis]